MAIDRDTIAAAVEQYLPRTANFAQSEDLGEKSKQDIFERLLQIILTAILLDDDAIYYTIFLSTQRLKTKVDATIATLELLQDTDNLKAVREDPPVRIEDISKLTESRLDLVQLSGTIAQGSFGDTHFDNYKANLNEFLTDQIGPNVQGRNRVAIEQSIRGLMETLATSWDDVLTAREELFQIFDNFEELDLRQRISTTIIEAIEQRLREIEEAIPELTTSAQAQSSEEWLVDLAAGSAALEVVGDPPPYLGTVVVGPEDAGFTLRDYLEVVGRGTLAPILPLMSGTKGRLSVTRKVGGLHGASIDDGDADDFTPNFRDTTKDLSLGAVEDYLTFLATGKTHRITEIVDADNIKVSPELRLGLTETAWVITADTPGKLFTDEDQDFWQEYIGGETGTPVLEGGILGSWIPIEKASGTDGSNLKAGGTGAETHPRITSGFGGVVDTADDSYFDPGSTWMTFGALPGHLFFLAGSGAGNDGTYTVVTFLSEEQITVTPSFTADEGPNGAFSYSFRETDYDNRIKVDSGADLPGKGIIAGDVLNITEAPLVGSYTISSLDGDREVVVPDTFGTREIGLDWAIYYPDDQFHSDSATFQSSNVQAGDVLEIDGDGDYEIATVIDQNNITVVGTLSSPGFDGVTWSIRQGEDAEAGTELTNLFEISDAGIDLADLGGTGAETGPAINGQPGILKVLGVSYTIQSYSGLVISVAETLEPDTGPLAWSIQAGEATRTLTDTANAPFSAFSDRDRVVLRPGATEERVDIQEVVSASELLLKADVTPELVGITYAIISSDVVGAGEGAELLTAGRRSVIEDIVDKSTLRVRPILPPALGIDVTWDIVTRGAKVGSRRLLDLDPRDQDNNPVDFTALDLIDQDIQLNVRSRPTRGKIESVEDASTLVLRTRLPVREHLVYYRILAQVEGQTDLFQFAAGLGGVAAADTLTVWGQDNVFNVEEPFSSWMRILPRIDSELSAQDFVVVRGGGEAHGRYLLYVQKNSEVTLDADTAELRRRVAEVLIDFGSVLENISGSVSTGAVVDDGDGDDDSPLFQDTTKDFTALGAQFGDRLLVTFDVNGDSITRRVYVESLSDDNTLFVEPELPLRVNGITATRVSWDLSRNSVSNSLVEVARLQQQMQSLLDVLEAYVVPVNVAIASALGVFQDQGMDRAEGLLLDGKIDVIADMAADDTSYASAARAAIQEVGQSTYSSAAVEDNVAGGSTVTSTSTSGATSSSSSVLGEEVETRVALANATQDLAADERVQTLAAISQEELLNRGIYQLTGEIESGVITDTDPTLPYIAETGSEKDRLEERFQRAYDALQYMIDNPDEFEDAEESSS